jgi:hypothetical protein
MPLNSVLHHSVMQKQCLHILTLGILCLNIIHLVYVDKELETMLLTQLGMICGLPAQSLPEEDYGKCIKTKL